MTTKYMTPLGRYNVVWEQKHELAKIANRLKKLQPEEDMNQFSKNLDALDTIDMAIMALEELCIEHARDISD